MEEEREAEITGAYATAITQDLSRLWMINHSLRPNYPNLEFEQWLRATRLVSQDFYTIVTPFVYKNFESSDEFLVGRLIYDQDDLTPLVKDKIPAIDVDHLDLISYANSMYLYAFMQGSSRTRFLEQEDLCMIDKRLLQFESRVHYPKSKYKRKSKALKSFIWSVPLMKNSRSSASLVKLYLLSDLQPWMGDTPSWLIPGTKLWRFKISESW
ncbi:hypothetical protein WAI453_003705 [Rhynchosporium graminicola]